MKKSKKVIAALIMMAVVLGGAGFGAISHAKAEPAENSGWVACFPEDTKTEQEEESEKVEEATEYENCTETESEDVSGAEEESEEPESEEMQSGKSEEEHQPMVSSDGTRAANMYPGIPPSPQQFSLIMEYGLFGSDNVAVKRYSFIGKSTPASVKHFNA